MYTLDYAESVAKDLANIRPHRRQAVLDAVENQLAHEPTRQTKNRKMLVGFVPPWEHVQPVWQLHIGEYRVFYDVDERASKVIVRAIRRKPPHKTTEEIL